MFENVGSLCVSNGGRAIGPRLESLEDRTTPAVVGPGVNGVVLDPVAVAQSAPIDRAFLAESARLSMILASFGTTEANQGADPRIRQLGQQIADEQTAILNATLPLLTVAGVPLQFSQFDVILLQTFPLQSPTTIDAQFTVLSTLYGLQFAALTQSELFLGVSPNVRAFAQAELFVIQQELLLNAALLGPISTLSITGLFGSFNALNPTLVIGTGSGTIALSTSGGFGPSSTVGFVPSNGFGPGASFGTSTGFGPSTTAGFGSSSAFGGFGFGSSSGFGPSNTVGF